MDIVEFGKGLVESGDLDPVYIVMWHAKLNKFKQAEWLLAYWCFYHVGTASWMIDQPDYWKAMLQAAGSKEWPRASERRHFRGQQATKAIGELQRLGLSPLKIIRNIGAIDEKVPFLEVAERVKRLRGFGDWVSFKVADMIERLNLCKVQFSNNDVFSMFESPTVGAQMLWESLGKARGAEKQTMLSWVVKYLESNLGMLTAPPQHERFLNIQEYETILCKWKSHMRGHYTVGHDIEEVKQGLGRFDCKTAKHLMQAGKTGGLW